MPGGLVRGEDICESGSQWDERRTHGQDFLADNSSCPVFARVAATTLLETSSLQNSDNNIFGLSNSLRTICNSGRHHLLKHWQ
jgi:hypothetical protein